MARSSQTSKLYRINHEFALGSQAPARARPKFFAWLLVQEQISRSRLIRLAEGTHNATLS
ncbi:hypothetical protein BDA96_10G059800 [Sorghum bicolor]|uniref:Uncharacterized protein n=1 Tax=Sorghum bicolor TaxID=4558 RepID=A0A921PZB3_SORBI|nr:hypothetical protein BDA96_10G059800 [Sorghum bicolor]